jgi:hypothetical protein
MIIGGSTYWALYFWEIQAKKHHALAGQVVRKVARKLYDSGRSLKVPEYLGIKNPRSRKRRIYKK